MKRVLKLMLSTALVFSSFTLSGVIQAEEQAGADIYPKPQSVQVQSDGMTLSGSVDIIVHGEQDVATLPKLEALLDAEGITYERKNEVGSNAAIILANDCDGCTICNSVEDAAGALNEEQGYVLKVDNSTNTKGQITIVGSDEDGVYYGVMTLKQLFAQKTSDGKIAKVVVSDYPDVKFRGYVEGFYGIPWTHEDRAELFEDTTNYKMTTYIYAPKDDPYHRASWRSLYPEKEAGELSELCEIAEANNMEFCWTIHPGADYNYTTDSDGDGMSDDFEILIEKLDQVYSFGVRQFGIFYDDLDYAVANGNNHAKVLNDAYAYLKNKYGDVKPMVTVVTRYTNSWGASWSSYFTPFMQQIHEDTLVLWTGQSTMSAITKDYMEYPKTQTGINRDYGVWWNYPVNDYQNSNMFMAPLDCLDNDVDNISSFFLNPMSEADASRVAIYSGADYSWNVSDFDSYNSWLRAIEELVPEAQAEFARFADNIAYLDQGNGFHFDESVYLEEDFQRFENATGDALLTEVVNMKEKFAQMISDADKLATIENEKLYDEIQYHLNAYKNVAEAGLACMKAYEAALKGDLGTCLQETPNINSKLAEARTHKIPILNGEAQVEVCANKIIPFIQEQAGKISTILNENTSAVRDAKFITNMSIDKEVSVMNTAYVFNQLNETMKAGDYVGIQLPKVMNIAGASASGVAQENFKLQYSLNGVVWYDMPQESVDNELSSDMIVTTAYVRLLCVKDASVNMDAFKVEQLTVVTSESVSASVSTDMQTYQTYQIANAMDGNMSTWFWSSTGSSDGNYIKVDLNKLTVLNEVVLYSGINKLGVVDGFASTKLEVSTDGSNWTAVGSTLSIDAYQDVDTTMKKLVFNANGVTARYFRFKAVGTSESWAKVYEITCTEGTMENTKGKKAQSNMSVVNGTLGAMIDESTTSSVTLAPSSQEDYVQVDLGTLEPLYDASITFTNGAGFKEVQLQTSANGSTWKDVATVVDSAYVVYGSTQVASFANSGILVRFIRFKEVSETTTNVTVCEIAYNQTFGISGTLTPSTNMGTYQTNSISYALDGNMDTKYYSNEEGNVGDYIQVDFGREIALYDTCIYYGGNPNVAGSVDGFIETQLQVSSDGQTWTNVGQPLASTGYEYMTDKYKASFETGGVSARYVRFVATESSTNWVQVYEIEFNSVMDSNNIRYADEASDGVVEFYPNEPYINGSTIDIAHSNLLDDGDINSKATIKDVENGQVLVYPMSVITNVKTISILQDANAITNAEVKVLKVDSDWQSVGTVDEAFKSFEINATILAVQFVFDGNVQPQIYEIMVEELGDYTPANYANVDAAIANVPTDLTIYTDETVAALNDALDAVVRGLDASQQERVDAMAKAIEDAIKALVEKPALTAPNAVANLVAKDETYNSIVLTWDASEEADEYDIYVKGYQDTEFKLIDTITETTYTYTVEKTGKEYSFYVVAKNEAGNSEDSEIVTVATSLHGTLILEMEKETDSRFKLSWNKIEGATRYIIYRKRAHEDEDKNKYQKVLTLKGSQLEYITAEMPQGEYSFIVKAGIYDGSDRVMTKGSNEQKGEVKATRPSVTLTARTKQIKVSWKKMEGVTHYQVYRATSSTGKYTKLVTTKELSYTAKSLKSGKKYYFKVRGYKTYKSGTKISYPVYTLYSATKNAVAK